MSLVRRGPGDASDATLRTPRPPGPGRSQRTGQSGRTAVRTLRQYAESPGLNPHCARVGRSLRGFAHRWSTLRSTYRADRPFDGPPTSIGGANVTARGYKLVALSLVLGGMTILLSGCSWQEV